MLKVRVYTLISLVIVVPLGLYSNAHRGQGNFWLNNSTSGLLYEVFWCLFFFLLVPKARTWKIVFWVFLATCILELLQLWHPPLLVPVRNTFIGKALIGSSFSFLDILYYIAGCLLAWIWIKGIQKIFHAKTTK
jgi:hypothetical protein